MVLLLIATGLLDLGRVFYFQVAMYDGVWEGGRHAAWYSPSLDSNPYLDDADILSAVNQSLNSRGLTAQFPSGTSSTCPTTSSTFKDPPYAASYYPSATQLNTPYLYICYKKPGGSYFGGMATAPANDSYALGDVVVVLLMSYGLSTGFLQNVIGNGIHVTAYVHFTIQGAGS